MKFSKNLFVCSIAASIYAAAAFGTQLPQGLETIATQCLGNLSDGTPVKGLTLGTLVVSPNELFGVTLGCERMRWAGDQLSLSAQFDQSISKGTADIHINNRPQAFLVQEGSLKGTFNETIDASDVDGTQIDASDIVSHGADGSIVVKRQYREIYLITELLDNDGQNNDQLNTRLVQRLILELNSQGQPVLRTNHFFGTVDPNTLASGIGGNANDYNSGAYLVQSIHASLSSCVLTADLSDAPSCVSSPTQRKIAYTVGAQYWPGLITILGWQPNHPPTNNQASWSANRVDFTKNLNELIAKGASSAVGKISAETASAWIKEAKDAINSAAN